MMMISLTILNTMLSQKFKHMSWNLLTASLFMMLGGGGGSMVTFTPQTQSFFHLSMAASYLTTNYWLLMLTLFLGVPLLSNSANTNKHRGLMHLLIIMLIMILAMAFSTNNMVMYYIMFESSILPTLMLILYWGYQPERLNASFYMLLYTISASLPLLMSILSLKQYYSYHMMMPNIKWMSTLMNCMMMAAFLIKIPIYSTHLWLPKAHVEAPVVGSMILAGLLLKIGVYGIIVSMSLLSSIPALSFIMMALILMGGVITACLCPQQTDIKSLIAYSSISHMSLTMAGLMTSNSFGWKSGGLLMITHGLISPLMFSAANNFYNHFKSRSLYLTTGIKEFNPNMSMWFFLIILANAAVPPNSSLISEMLAATSLLMYSIVSGLPFAIMAISTMMYSSILYTSTNHNQIPETLKFIASPMLFNTTSPSLLIPVISMPLMSMNMF